MNKEAKIEWLIFISSVAFYLGFSVFMVAEYGSTYILGWGRYWHDQLPHVYISRTVIDNGPLSKLANVGTVWLPLYHLILIPFILPDPFYVNGLGAAILNSFLTASTSVLIYRIAKGGKLGLIASFIFTINMYSLIHSSSSYMVPIGMYLSVASVYYSIESLRKNSAREMAKAMVLLMLAELSRYESWIVGLAIVLAVWFGLKKSRAVKLIFTFMASWGVVLWLLYNRVIFGSFIQFIIHPSPGAAGYYYLIIEKLANPIEADWFSILKVSYLLMGPVIALVFLSLFHFFFQIYKKRKVGAIEYLVMLLPLVFLLVESPKLLISDHPLYFYFVLPFAIGAGFRAINHSTKAITILILVLVGGQCLYEFQRYGGLPGEIAKDYKIDTYARERLRPIYGVWKNKGGYILSSTTLYLPSYAMSVLLGISPAYIFDEYDEPVYREINKAPWEYGVTVVLMPTYDTYLMQKRYMVGLVGEEMYPILFYENEAWRNEFLSHYRFETEIGYRRMVVLVYVSKE